MFESLPQCQNSEHHGYMTAGCIATRQPMGRASSRGDDGCGRHWVYARPPFQTVLPDNRCRQWRDNLVCWLSYSDYIPAGGDLFLTVASAAAAGPRLDMPGCNTAWPNSCHVPPPRQQCVGFTPRRVTRVCRVHTGQRRPSRATGRAEQNRSEFSPVGEGAHGGTWGTYVAAPRPRGGSSGILWKCAARTMAPSRGRATHWPPIGAVGGWLGRGRQSEWLADAAVQILYVMFCLIGKWANVFKYTDAVEYRSGFFSGKKMCSLLTIPTVKT